MDATQSHLYQKPRANLPTCQRVPSIYSPCPRVTLPACPLVENADTKKASEDAFLLRPFSTLLTGFAGTAIAHRLNRARILLFSGELFLLHLGLTFH